MICIPTRRIALRYLTRLVLYMQADSLAHTRSFDIGRRSRDSQSGYDNRLKATGFRRLSCSGCPLDRLFVRRLALHVQPAVIKYGRLQSIHLSA